MKYSIKVGAADKINSDCIAVVVWNKGGLSEEAQLADKVSNKGISKIVRSEDFTGTLGQTHIVYNPIGLKSKRLLLIGGGEIKKLDAKNASRILTAGLKAVFASNAASVHFAVASLNVKDETPAWVCQRLAQEAETASYRYNTTKSTKSKAVSANLISVSPSKGARRKSLEEALKSGSAIGAGINRARHLGNLPGKLSSRRSHCNRQQT